MSEEGSHRRGARATGAPLARPLGDRLIASRLRPALAAMRPSAWRDDEVVDAVLRGPRHARRAPWRPTPVHAASIPLREEPAPVELDAIAVHWIEIELVDEIGEPVRHERYEIELPDGTVVRGALDHRGRARVDRIESPGQCKVRFPRLDGEAWEPA